MPRYRVREIRAREVAYVIISENERAARRLEGEIIDESGTDDYGERNVSVEEVGDDEDEA